MPAPAAPLSMDATVAFDDLVVERWHHIPCLMCQAARPGHDLLWRERETGFIPMFPLCQRGQRRPDHSDELAHAIQSWLHAEER